ncbi:TOMM precursor leader peptide-binding protein [Streptomyces sp. TRM 70361]|uniref:TOMM precursor leader peptide-binding protein n=1 Tax=Streptomyces sp. TRM 70361 TaxID=3116553 RepID=UPI002E7B12A5|nr:TOMM precursor leader peptide-binding protein [Streptomyces sp. TRM 70361]MEE1940882.1 TOMM precursor leader peptide-binding protein [Streptomyces sp. TRM 70361]
MTHPAETTDSPRATGTRLVRNPYLTVVQCTDDEVLLRHGSRSRYSRVLRDDGRHRVLGPLLRAFAEPQPPDDIVRRFADRAAKERLAELVAQLADDGVLVPEDSGGFAMHRSLLGARPVRGLEETTVGLVGSGAVGAQLAAQLTELGVGQVPVLAAGAGGLAEPDGDEALAGLLDGADLTVLALDGFRPSLLHRLNRAAVAAGRPWLPVYADGSELIVGPLVVPGESACYNEHEIQHESSRALRQEYQLYSEELARRTADDLPPLLAPYAAIAASWAAVGTAPYLVDGASFLVGRAIRIDLERLEITREHVLRLPRCPVCTEQRPAFRHPFL